MAPYPGKSSMLGHSGASDAIAGLVCINGPAKAYWLYPELYAPTRNDLTVKWAAYKIHATKWLSRTPHHGKRSVLGHSGAAVAVTGLVCIDCPVKAYGLPPENTCPNTERPDRS